MKKRVLTHGIFLIVVMVLLVGCKGTPVFNVKDANINTVSGNDPALGDVTRAIISAAANSNPPWNMEIVQPGHIVATLHNRTHMAKVDIEYTTKGYSITRKDSADLKYDPESDTIHEGYNRWVQRLDSNIRIKLNML